MAERYVPEYSMVHIEYPEGWAVIQHYTDVHGSYYRVVQAGLSTRKNAAALIAGLKAEQDAE